MSCKDKELYLIDVNMNYAEYWNIGQRSVMFKL